MFTHNEIFKSSASFHLPCRSGPGTHAWIMLEVLNKACSRSKNSKKKKTKKTGEQKGSTPKWLQWLILLFVADDNIKHAYAMVCSRCFCWNLAHYSLKSLGIDLSFWSSGIVLQQLFLKQMRLFSRKRELNGSPLLVPFYQKKNLKIQIYSHNKNIQVETKKR